MKLTKVLISLYVVLTLAPILGCQQIGFGQDAKKYSMFDKTFLPEGLTFCNNKLYVGIATRQEIYTVNERGELKYFSSLPKLGKKKGVMTGLACGSKGELYAALDSKDSAVSSGVYRVSKDGGAAKPFSLNRDFVFPNGCLSRNRV